MNDKNLDAELFMSRLKGALLYRGGNGEIPQEVRKFITSCYWNEITFKVIIDDNKDKNKNFIL